MPRPEGRAEANPACYTEASICTRPAARPTSGRAAWERLIATAKAALLSRACLAVAGGLVALAASGGLLSACGPMSDIVGPMIEMMQPPPVPDDDDDPPIDTTPPPSSVPDGHACAQEPSFVGPSPVRLLTRAEYNNTLRDLLGDDTQPAGAFPVENETLGFENGEAHVANPLLVEQYMNVAEAVATRAVATHGLPWLLDCAYVVVGELECLESFVESFGAKAFRRPLSAAERAAFEDLADASLSEFGLEETVEILLQAFLQSPQFLYRIETGPTGDASSGDRIVQLTSWEMASRLSYFLWGSMPDATLRAAAAQNLLRSPGHIEAQARRMLDDERAKEMMWDFHRQWLDLDRLDGLTKDETANPGYDPALRGYWKSELKHFIQHATYGSGGDGSGGSGGDGEGGDGEGGESSGGNLETLLTSRTTFVNGPLAAVYDIPAPGEGYSEQAFSEVTVPANERAGLLTQPGLMALLALPEQSSPIFRGLFVREDLFCTELQPPPPDIVIVPPDPDPNATTRERFAEHTENELCQGCHILIDPLGFGFERYDAMGRYRTEENGLPVDASGEVAFSGDETIDGPFDGAVELAERLATSSAVRSCMTKHWFHYTIGRRELPGDEACNLGYPRERFEATRGDFQELVVALTQTHAFRYRRTGDEESGQ